MKKLLNRKTRGYTMIELVVVVVIIGILASVTMWSLTSFFEKSKSVEAKEILAKTFGGFNRLVVDGEPTSGMNWSRLGFDWNPNLASARNFDYVFDNDDSPNTLNATRRTDATKWIMIDLWSGRMTKAEFYGK